MNGCTSGLTGIIYTIKSFSLIHFSSEMKSFLPSLLAKERMAEISVLNALCIFTSELSVTNHFLCLAVEILMSRTHDSYSSTGLMYLSLLVKFYRTIFIPIGCIRCA